MSPQRPALLFVPSVALICFLDHLTFGAIAGGKPAMFAFTIASALVATVVALIDLLVVERCSPLRAPEIRATLSMFTFVTFLVGAIWMAAQMDVSDESGARLMFLYTPTLCTAATILWHTARMIRAMRYRILLGAIFFLATTLVEWRSRKVDSDTAPEIFFVPYSLLLSFMVGIALCIWGATSKAKALHVS